MDLITHLQKISNRKKWESDDKLREFMMGRGAFKKYV